MNYRQMESYELPKPEGGLFFVGSSSKWTCLDDVMRRATKLAAGIFIIWLPGLLLVYIELEVKIRCAVNKDNIVDEDNPEMLLPMVIQTWADGRQGEVVVVVVVSSSFIVIIPRGYRMLYLFEGFLSP